VEVGASYGAAPDDVRDALMAAVRQAKYVLPAPAPDVIVTDFGGSAIVYRTRFWIDDFSKDDLAQDAVRTRIYYEFRRRNIEIPWPIQIQYDRVEPPADTPERRDRFAKHVAGVRGTRAAARGRASRAGRRRARAVVRRWRSHCARG
jgi:small-conductance mechanosensitive channel